MTNDPIDEDRIITLTKMIIRYGPSEPIVANIIGYYGGFDHICKTTIIPMMLGTHRRTVYTSEYSIFKTFFNYMSQNLKDEVWDLLYSEKDPYHLKLLIDYIRSGSIVPSVDKIVDFLHCDIHSLRKSLDSFVHAIVESGLYTEELGARHLYDRDALFEECCCHSRSIESDGMNPRTISILIKHKLCNPAICKDTLMATALVYYEVFRAAVENGFEFTPEELHNVLRLAIRNGRHSYVRDVVAMGIVPTHKDILLTIKDTDNPRDCIENIDLFVKKSDIQVGNEYLTYTIHNRISNHGRMGILKHLVSVYGCSPDYIPDDIDDAYKYKARLKHSQRAYRRRSQC